MNFGLGGHSQTKTELEQKVGARFLNLQSLPQWFVKNGLHRQKHHVHGDR